MGTFKFFVGTDAFSMAGIERSTLPASILIQDGSTFITEKGFARQGRS